MSSYSDGGGLGGSGGSSSGGGGGGGRESKTKAELSKAETLMAARVRTATMDGRLGAIPQHDENNNAVVLLADSKSSSSWRGRPHAQVDEMSGISEEILGASSTVPPPSPFPPSSAAADNLPAEAERSEMELMRKWCDSQDGIDFQSLSQLQQRLGYIWQRKFHTDVVFKVGSSEEPVEAHRLILASASSTFEQLLYESQPLRSPDKKFILYEPDFDTLTFKLFLKILYTNEIPLCLPLKLGLAIFDIAKKYGIHFLTDSLLSHIDESITVTNVFDALAVSTKSLELTHLVRLCWKIIEAKTEAVMAYHLETLSGQLLSRILDRDQLNIQEIELFKHLVKWSSLECKRRNIKPTGKSKREMLEPLIKKIRFTTMTIPALHEFVIPSRILDSYEISCILDYKKHPNELTAKAIPYKVFPRAFAPPAPPPRRADNPRGQSQSGGEGTSSSGITAGTLRVKTLKAKGSGSTKGGGKVRGGRIPGAGGGLSSSVPSSARGTALPRGGETNKMSAAASRQSSKSTIARGVIMKSPPLTHR